MVLSQVSLVDAGSSGRGGSARGVVGTHVAARVAGDARVKAVVWVAGFAALSLFLSAVLDTVIMVTWVHLLVN